MRGNSSFDFGLVKEEETDKEVLHSRPGQLGWNSHQTSSGELQRLECYQQLVELSADMATHELRVATYGRLGDDEDLRTWMHSAGPVLEEQTQVIVIRSGAGGWRF